MWGNLLSNSVFSLSPKSDIINQNSVTQSLPAVPSCKKRIYKVSWIWKLAVAFYTYHVYHGAVLSLQDIWELRQTSKFLNYRQCAILIWCNGQTHIITKSNLSKWRGISGWKRADEKHLQLFPGKEKWIFI